MLCQILILSHNAILSSSRNQTSSSFGSHIRHTFSCSHKPHKGNHPAWVAINRLLLEHGHVELEHFRLFHRVGSGSMRNVYLCLNTSGSFIEFDAHCLYAMKVLDTDALRVSNKLHKAAIERKILGMFDHLFLPTLHAEFDCCQYSCLVMEYCPGGDLLTFLQRESNMRFSIPTAKKVFILLKLLRFYAAEVLVALDYLHMMGVIYRDLKPENVFVQEDGHIMLSDVDLSLTCNVSPKLIKFKTNTMDNNRNCNSHLPILSSMKKKKTASNVEIILQVEMHKSDVEIWG
ncbi:Kinase PINOID 2, putative [Theobroma cacao]|uniref:non-specific serine/threonine protein kinase n=1 Tax=Theobroma cacao TaxID=3641 RepID=A0A061G9G6_THECC|nr:Kinase PINOID 2, putative [Theobroma cacao]